MFIYLCYVLFVSKEQKIWKMNGSNEGNFVGIYLCTSYFTPETKICSSY